MQELEDVRRRLQAHAGTHPMLVAYWSEYLGELVKACALACGQAEQVMANFPLVQDPTSVHQIAALHVMGQTLLGRRGNSA